jgi:hypothetical protein
MRPSVSRRPLLAAALAAMATVPMAGCWGTSQAHAVDPPRAREALKIALDHWKSGQSPRSLESSPTPMTVQDFDWAGGTRLVDYQIVDDGTARDANLSVRVKLVLDGAGKSPGKPVERAVWYLVGTSPSVMVFRDMLRR